MKRVLLIMLHYSVAITEEKADIELKY
uniref:Uncharacterized protein n=1 Tax=Rhizophora mucronata TaxID=61149 RepID=A0A2P2N267_RHIMU